MGKSAAVNLVDNEGPRDQNDWPIRTDICRSARYTTISGLVVSSMIYRTVPYMSKQDVSDLSSPSAHVKFLCETKSDRAGEGMPVEQLGLRETMMRYLRDHKMFVVFPETRGFQLRSKVPTPRVKVDPRLSQFVVLKGDRGAHREGASSYIPNNFCE